MNLQVLIVEDEALLALELEDMLLDAGHDVVGTAATKADALALADAHAPSFAFVDLHLLDGATGIEVAAHLKEKAIPFVFLTGNVRKIPADFVGGLGAIEKPYTMHGLQNALNFLETRLAGELSAGPVPPSFIPGPAVAETAA